MGPQSPLSTDADTLKWVHQSRGVKWGLQPPPDNDVNNTEWTHRSRGVYNIGWAHSHHLIMASTILNGPTEAEVSIILDKPTAIT
jgi:hypothetical protein